MFCHQCVMAAENGCGSDGALVGACKKNDTISRLQDVIIFGVKGMAAYRYMADQLDAPGLKEVDDVAAEALYMTLTNVNFNYQDHVDMLMKVGRATRKVMEILEDAHAEHFGVPTPVAVSQDRAEGKCILVSGHDLLALKRLLEQSEGKGVNVYTHSEMLPAHGYPELRKYPHLKGNLGKSWTNQSRTFAKFPGAIVVNTNCIVPPTSRSKYKGRLFGSGHVAVEGIKHLENYDFSEVIKTARSLPSADLKSNKTVSTGHNWRTMLRAEHGLVEAAKSGKIQRFFVIAGCDAPGKGGDYYRRLAKALPADCVLITSACGKYRFNDIDFGTVAGTDIPRYIDLGQCNDSGGAVEISRALARAYEGDFNNVPLTIVLSWMEQKAVAILLGLLDLGIVDIWLGPKPPNFGNLEVWNMFLDDFKMNLTWQVEADLPRMLAEPVKAA